jgi:hypothetical protein
VDARWAAATRKETRRTIIIVRVGSVGCTLSRNQMMNANVNNCSMVKIF